MRFLIIIAALSCTGLQAQSIAITSPAANQVLSGFNGFPFSVSMTGLASATRVCYQVDGYPAAQQGQNAIAQQGCSIIAPYTLTANSFSWFNGPHTLRAIAYDALGNVLATSAPVTFNAQNTWPVSYNPTLSVSPSTPFTSNWSGTVNLALTLGGSGASHNHVYTCFIDGYILGASSTSATNTATCAYPTTAWANGNHNVCWNVQDGISGLSVPGDGTYYPSTGTTWGVNSLGAQYAGQHAEGCQIVTFSNTGASKAPYFVNVGSREVFISPGRTYQMPACTGVYTDGSTTSPTCQYFSSDATSCTVSATGLVTIPSSPANYNCVIYTFWPVTTASYSWNGAILSGTGGYTIGWGNLNNIFYIQTASPSSGSIAPGSWAYADNNGSVNGNGTTNTFLGFPGTGINGATGTMTVGPARITWMLISPSNVLAHFGSDGLIHNSYAAGTSMFVHWLFSTYTPVWAPSSPNGTQEPPYNPGVFADIQNSGFNTFAVGYSPATYNTYSTESAFHSATQSYIASQTANLTNSGGCPKCFFRLLDVLDGGDQLFAGTRGLPSTWTPSFYADLNTQWMATGKALTAQSTDEITSKWGGNPLSGQWKVGTNGLIAATSNGSGGCATTGNAGLFGFLNGAGGFAITGSNTGNQGAGGLNSVYPNLYTPGTVPFSFTCGTVPSGTYSASNDPNLTLEQFSYSWYSYGGITDFNHYDAFARFRNGWTSVSPYPPISHPPVAFSGGAVEGNWGGNASASSGSTTIQGVSQVGDYCEPYTNAAFTTMLAQRTGTPSFALGANPTGNSPTLMDTLRKLFYGAPGINCNPQLPRATLVGVTSNSYGFESYDTDTVVSCIGNVVTFAHPHFELAQIKVSSTRMTITGSSDSNCNAQLYIDHWVSPTQVAVSYATMTFSGSGNGGTITFSPSGYTTAIASSGTGSVCHYSGNGAACAEGNASAGESMNFSQWCDQGLCASPILLASADTNVWRHRCETFTISGNSLSGFNGSSGTVFYYPCENSPSAWLYNANTIWFRQIPQANGTGGTATILPGAAYWRGVNGTPGWDEHPAAIADTYWIGVMEGVSEFGFYQYESSCNAYNSDGTLGGNCLDHAPQKAFTDTGTNWQHGMNAHFEDGFSVPTFHALSLAEMLVQAKSKYILQPHLNSPDCGSLTIECAAMGGSYGDAVMAVNLAQANQSVTLNYSPYLVTGQQIARFNVTDSGVRLTLIPAGTTTETVVLGPDEKVLVLFPVNFATELNQPSISARLADVPNATDVAIRYGYDLYMLDASSNTVVDCGAISSGCVLPADRNIGQIYYRMIYRNSSGQVLATSGLQTF